MNTIIKHFGNMFEQILSDNDHIVWAPTQPSTPQES